MNLPGRSNIQRQPALAEQVAEILSSEIISGAFAPGMLFPSEAELAQKLDVSRTVVREALARLKQDGLLETRKGGRTKVAENLSRRALRLEDQNDLDLEWMRHLYELRAIIESEGAALAALRATKKDLAHIKTAYTELEKAIAKGGLGTKESFNFHRAVVEASGNPHLTKLVDWVDDKAFAFTRTNNLIVDKNMIDSAQAEHEGIVKAVQNGDAAEARRISREHIIHAARRRGLNISLP